MEKARKRGKLLAGFSDHLLAQLRPELRDDPDDLLLEFESGHESYLAALQCLLNRFARSGYCAPDLSGKPRKAPDRCVTEAVHSLIVRFFGNDKVFPLSPEGRPLGAPEIALIMGAVLATAAAQAYEDGLVTLEQIDDQFEIAWIALHDWLPRGVLYIRDARAKGVIPQVPR